MTTIDERLARKGRSEPRRAVLQQARVLEKLVSEHKTSLANHGWDDADSLRFSNDITAAQTMIEGRAEASSEADSTTKGEHAALDSVKAFLRRLRLALPRVLRDNAALGVTMVAFAVEEPLRRSTPRFIAYLIKICPAVEKLDEPLKKHFGGNKASVELNTVKVALEKVDTDQETAQAAGPVETQMVNEAIGRLLEDIEDIIRAGKSAFDGQATVAPLQLFFPSYRLPILPHR
jgi:hypothetical protein